MEKISTYEFHPNQIPNTSYLVQNYGIYIKLIMRKIIGQKTD